MTVSAPWLLYGAYGFTGSLIAREAASRGVPLILSGRREAPLAKLAKELGLPWRVLALDDESALRTAIAASTGVLNCAGPFVHTAGPLITACLSARRHYLDIAGEIDVFERAHERRAEARAAGIALCPGVGFDVVPTDCLASALKQRLPNAMFLALGFDTRQKMSPGTARTTIQGLGRGGRIRFAKEIVDVPLGTHTRKIDFGAGEKLAVAIPWGDVATALYSTGIGNVQVYVPVSPRSVRRMRRLNLIRPFFSIPPVPRIAESLAAARNRGPDDRELATGRVHVWGEARAGDGMAVVGRLETPNGYALTRDAALAAILRLREKPVTTGGYYTPSLLFGAGFVETLPGVGGMEFGPQAVRLDNAA